MNEVLARSVARALVGEEMVSGVSEDGVARIVVGVLERDRVEEQEINDEAKRLMERYAGNISRQSMDTGVLYRKFRSEIAKKRGYPL